MLSQFDLLIAAVTRQHNVILLTADSSARVLRFALDAKLLQKPVGLDELETAVKEACAGTNGSILSRSRNSSTRKAAGARFPAGPSRSYGSAASMSS